MQRHKFYLGAIIIFTSCLAHNHSVVSIGLIMIFIKTFMNKLTKHLPLYLVLRCGIYLHSIQNLSVHEAHAPPISSLVAEKQCRYACMYWRLAEIAASYIILLLD